MKAVIFGGSGFLGSHVADSLLSAGHEVTIFDSKVSPYIKLKQEMAIGNILDFDAVNKITKNVDIVYNFAGVADVDISMVNPLDTIKQNILGNSHILEACRINGVNRFVFASTIYVYSEAGSFYRGSKQACEIIIENYHREYNLNFTILRYGSLYGTRSDERNWIYRILRQALDEKRIIREGDGEEIREYIHVYDAARLSVRALDEEFRNQYVMITGQQSIKVKDVLMMIREMLDNRIDINFTDTRREGHYKITPYNFRPRLAKKIIDSTYVDLGQGIFELLHTLYDQDKGIVSPRKSGHLKE